MQFDPKNLFDSLAGKGNPDDDPTREEPTEDFREELQQTDRNVDRFTDFTRGARNFDELREMPEFQDVGNKIKDSLDRLVGSDVFEKLKRPGLTMDEFMEAEKNRLMLKAAAAMMRGILSGEGGSGEDVRETEHFKNSILAKLLSNEDLNMLAAYAQISNSGSETAKAVARSEGQQIISRAIDKRARVNWERYLKGDYKPA